MEISSVNIIDKELISNSSNNSFDSALGWHIFNNPSHTILFEKSSLISNDLGIKQVVQESIEINLKINNNISLNRDLGEYSLNSLYSNLIKNDLTKYFTKPIYNSTEPATKRPLRQAAKKQGWLWEIAFNHLVLFSLNEFIFSLHSFCQSWLNFVEVRMLGLFLKTSF